MNREQTKKDMVEERLQALEEQVARLEASRQIQNQMNRYAIYCGAGLGRRIVEELWTKTEEASLEYGASGVYQNLWKVKTFYIKEKIPGRLTTVSFSDPYIEVSADGKRARGIWRALATETDAGDLGRVPPKESDSRRRLLSSETENGEKYRAEIMSQIYDVDFVPEGGTWKILHLRVREYFRCPYDRDWVRFSEERFETDGVWLESMFETPIVLPPESHGENLPSAESTKHWQYTTERLPQLTV